MGDRGGGVGAFMEGGMADAVVVGVGVRAEERAGGAGAAGGGEVRIGERAGGGGAGARRGGTGGAAAGGGGVARTGEGNGDEDTFTGILDGLLGLVSFSVQLAARSAMALPIPQSPLLRGGTGGAWLVGVWGGSDTSGSGIGSSQILSTRPVRTKDHKVHVVRRRDKHQLDVHSGYMDGATVVGVEGG